MSSVARPNVLIAGDSNLKQLSDICRQGNVTSGLQIQSSQVLCVPGARYINDAKEFQAKMLSKVRKIRPKRLILHIGSNDISKASAEKIVK
jgi:hypothetical protein